MKQISVEKNRGIFSIPENNKQKSKEFIIYLFTKGTGVHIVGRNTYKFKESFIHFVSPGETHFFRNKKNVAGYCIRFGEDFVFANTEHKDVLFRLPFFSYELVNPQIRITGKAFKWACAVAENMYNEIQHENPFSRRIVLSCLNILILHCNNFLGNKNIRSYTKRPGNAYSLADPDHYTCLEITANYKKLISRHFMQEHKVSFYAANMSITSNYLNSVVKSITGQTASQLIHAKLIQESMYLLIHSKLSLKEVGSALGFADHSYFTKFFKRFTGQTPLAWFNTNK